MADTPNSAQVIIVSATYGSAVGICTDFIWGYDEVTVPVRPGDSYYNVQITVGASLVAEVTCLHGALTVNNNTPASLVLVTKKGDGTSQTYTLTNMKLISAQVIANRDSAPFLIKHRFISSGTVAQP